MYKYEVFLFLYDQLVDANTLEDLTKEDYAQLTHNTLKQKTPSSTSSPSTLRLPKPVTPLEQLAKSAVSLYRSPSSATNSLMPTHCNTSQRRITTR